MMPVGPLRPWISRLCAISAVMAGGVCFVAEADAGQIVFASYNLENYFISPGFEGNGRTPTIPKPEKQIDAEIEVILQIHPDILGVMEMGDQKALDDFQGRLKRAGLDYDYREWLQGADPVRHLALLSRFPIIARNSVADVPFDMDGRVEHMQRGILDVTVQVAPSFPLRLVGVHLKSRLPVPDESEWRLRAIEAWHLRDHIDGIMNASPDTRLLVFGDFNDTKNQYPIKEISGTSGSANRLDDLWLRDGNGERWTEYWKYADVYSRIDYIFVNRALMPIVVKGQSGISPAAFWNDASDHRAIYATISIP